MREYGKSPQCFLVDVFNGAIKIFKPLLAALMLVLCSAAVVHAHVHHYVFFNLERERISDVTFLGTKAFEGAQLKYTWKELEPQKDKYDFTQIEKALEFLKGHGKRLFVQLQDVTFSQSGGCVPQYLLKEPEFSGGVEPMFAKDGKTIDGYVSRRWDKNVEERYLKLIAALGQQFDGRIAGINLPETAMDVLETGKSPPKGFTPAIYRDVVLANMAALKKAFPKSVCIQYANFMPDEWLPADDHSYLRSIYKGAAQRSVGVGGPDLFPYKTSQMNHAYKFMHEWKHDLPVAIAVQEGNYAYKNPKTQKQVTMDELITFAADYLHAKYIFWCTEDPYYSQEVIPFLRSSK